MGVIVQLRLPHGDYQKIKENEQNAKFLIECTETFKDHELKCVHAKEGRIVIGIKHELNHFTEEELWNKLNTAMETIDKIGEHSTLHHHDAKKNPPAAYDEYVRQQKAKVKEVKNNLSKWLRKEDGEFQKKVSDEKKRIERRSRRENQPQDIDWSDSMKYLFNEDRHQKEKQKQEASDRLARKNSWDANGTDLPRKNSLVRRKSFDGNGRDSDLSAEFEAQQAEEARKVKEVKTTLGKWF